MFWLVFTIAMDVLASAMNLRFLLINGDNMKWWMIVSMMVLIVIFIMVAIYDFAELIVKMMKGENK